MSLSRQLRVGKALKLVEEAFNSAFDDDDSEDECDEGDDDEAHDILVEIVALTTPPFVLHRNSFRDPNAALSTIMTSVFVNKKRTVVLFCSRSFYRVFISLPTGGPNHHFEVYFASTKTNSIILFASSQPTNPHMSSEQAVLRHHPLSNAALACLFSAVEFR